MNELNRFYLIFSIAVCVFAGIGIMSNTLSEVIVGVLTAGVLFVAALVHFVIGHLPQVQSHTKT